jgi:hypothetical protein
MSYTSMPGSPGGAPRQMFWLVLSGSFLLVNVTLPAAHLDALDQIAAARGAKRQDVTHSPVAEYLWHHRAISGHGQATRR